MTHVFEKMKLDSVCFEYQISRQFDFTDALKLQLNRKFCKSHTTIKIRFTVQVTIFSEAGSPDTQRTLSMGTLTSLSPDINNVTTIMHQHAEPRFIFYMVS